MQRICFCKTVSLFNHVLQPSQALALFYQSLIFSLKNLALIKWISSNVDIPIGLQLLMIDINGNVTVNDELFYKQLSTTKRDAEQQTDTTSILKWISRLVLRLATDCSVSSKSDRSHDFESFNEFLKQFHIISTDDRSTLSDDDEGISNDDLDEEDISRRAIHRALIKCIDYTTINSTDTPNSTHNTTEMQDFESSSTALYNQQIIQILCSDTLELEIELARDSRQSSFESLPQTSTNDNTLISYHSVWATLWRDVTIEYLQFKDNNRLRKRSLDNFRSIRENDRLLDELSRRHRNLKKPIIKSNEMNENHFCLHDRLMFEIKQKKILKPIEKTLINRSITFDSNRKRIRPVKKLVESDLSSDDDDNQRRDEYGRKRVVVVDCLLESSSSSDDDDDTESELTIKNVSGNGDEYVDITMDALILINHKTSSKKFHYTTIENIELEHISMEKLIRLMKDSSDALALTYDEFCHIRNVITRAELETLLFDEKLYNEVALSKLCFTCRKVHFNLLTFTFGIQCNVCKQKVCRNCITQIALPKDKLNDLPIQAFTPLTLSKSLSNSEKCHSLDTQSPLTPVMNDVLNDLNYDDYGSRRCSTPGNPHNKLSDSAKWRTEPIDICTDCFFLLQQIRKKSRQRHIAPAVTSSLVSSTSSSFNRSYLSSSRSTSNYNLSTSSSASSIALLLAQQQQQQQQQRSLMVKTTSIHSNLKQARSAQELSINNDPLQTLPTLGGAVGGTERVSLSRRNLFLNLQPAYDVKLNNIKTG